MPVYAYNSTYDDFIQYTCGEAYASYNSNDIQGSSLSKKIYLSMTTLEGTGTSYKEQTGALLDYKYENGDTLNIIKYKNKAGSIIYPDSYSFKIVEYKYLTEKESNLFLTKTSSNKKNGGWYLVLDSEDFEGFSNSSIISNSDLWSSETLIEIQKPKKDFS